MNPVHSETMRRIHLKAISSLIRNFCESAELCLCEISFPASWGKCATVYLICGSLVTQSFKEAENKKKKKLLKQSKNTIRFH